MTNIYREYVTPHIICIHDKLNRNLISLLNIYECSVDLREFECFTSFISNMVINFNATVLMQLPLFQLLQTRTLKKI